MTNLERKLSIINNHSSPEALLNFLIKFSRDVADLFGVNKSVKQEGKVATVED